MRIAPQGLRPAKAGPSRLANDAEVGAGGAAQFLRLMRVFAGAGFGTFHQVLGDAFAGAVIAARQMHETGKLRNKAVHQNESPRDAVKSFGLPRIRVFPSFSRVHSPEIAIYPCQSLMSKAAVAHIARVCGRPRARPTRYACPMPCAPPSASPPPVAVPLPGELLLRQIASSIAEMLWSVDPANGVLTYTNPAFERFWGASAASLNAALHAAAPPTQPWHWLETLLLQVEPADRPAVRHLHLAAVQLPAGHTLDYDARTGSGKRAQLRQRVVPVQGPAGTLRVIHLASDLTWQHDTTSRLRAEISRRTDSEAQYQAVVENVNQGILITAAGRILYANPKALQLIELDDGTARSRPFIEFIHPEDRERVLGNHMRRMRGEPVENYYHFRVAHGGMTPRWLEISAVLFQWQGQTATLNFLTDVTQKRQAEQDMQSALLRERELSELKSRFIAVASHEFRTPLAAILSSVELLDSYGDSFPASERQELLGQVKTAVTRMTGMVEQVLMSSRLESGGFSFQPQSLTVAELLVQVVVEMERSDTQASRITVQCNGLDAPRRADERLLRHIVTNLLSNALKYSPPEQPVQLAASAEGELLQISVGDAGIGIPEADLPRLFDTFHRGTNVANIAGTGIGLHIVKQCVDLHGGKITVASLPGQGTVFTVRLPAPMG